MILEQVRDTLREANIITTDKEFCEVWLGKSECYLRSLRFNDISPSADALANCAARLAWTASGLRARDAVAHAHWSYCQIWCPSDHHAAVSCWFIGLMPLTKSTPWMTSAR